MTGGLSVNAHGYLRFNAEEHLILVLAPGSVRRAFEALRSIGYHPTVPTAAEQSVNRAMRPVGLRQDGIRMLAFFDDDDRGAPIDVLGEARFHFEDEYEAALRGEIRPGIGAFTR